MWPIGSCVPGYLCAKVGRGDWNVVRIISLDDLCIQKIYGFHGLKL